MTNILRLVAGVALAASMSTAALAAPKSPPSSNGCAHAASPGRPHACNHPGNGGGTTGLGNPGNLKLVGRAGEKDPGKFVNGGTNVGGNGAYGASAR